MNVIALPRANSDGSIVTQFVDSVESTTRTYTYPTQQENLKVINKGKVNVTLNVGTFTAQTILPGATWQNNVLYTSLTLSATSQCQVDVTSRRYDNIQMTRSTINNLIVGTDTQDATNPEAVLVNCGTTTSENAEVLKGNVNDFLQLNIINSSTGAKAQAGICATTNDGNNTAKFIWMGVNNSAFNDNESYNVGKAEDVNIIGAGQDMYVSNSNATKSLKLCTGAIVLDGTTSANVRMEITAIGNVGIGGTPSASNILDVKSTTLAFSPPRMTTTQKNAIASPAEGMVVYDLTLHKLSIYTGAAWETITSV